MSALLAYFHSLAMIALGSLLFVQLLSVNKLQDRQELQRFILFCFGIAVAAAVMLVSGIALLVWSERGAAFFLHNPVFYIKLAVFAAMLLIAITPARIILQWGREAKAGTIPEPGSILFVKRYLIVELVLLLAVPLAASLSARGIGLQSSPG